MIVDVNFIVYGICVAVLSGAVVDYIFEIEKPPFYGIFLVLKIIVAFFVAIGFSAPFL